MVGGSQSQSARPPLDLRDHGLFFVTPAISTITSLPAVARSLGVTSTFIHDTLYK